VTACPHLLTGAALRDSIIEAGHRAGDRRVALARPGEGGLWRGPLPGWDVARAEFLDAAARLDPSKPETCARFVAARLAWLACGAWSDESTRPDCILRDYRTESLARSALSAAVHALPAGMRTAVLEAARAAGAKMLAEDRAEEARRPTYSDTHTRCEYCGAAEDHETPTAERIP
jgi:hypothetical protein